MQPLEKPRYTPEEYLALERAAEFRSELIDGEIVARSGASANHNVVAGNCFAAIHYQLRGRPCRIFMADMRVRVDSAGLYTYPDLAGLCGAPVFDDEQADTLLNPGLLVEVLSPSTEAYDRGEKFALYRRLDSLIDYVLVSQDKMRVEHYRRRDEQWVLTVYESPATSLVLDSLAATLPIGEIYDKVLPAREEPSS
jgi:Uma2 family endonuclease